MPSQREVLAALYGAWRLMRFDASGMNWFDLTLDGFWRSFFAAVPVAPFFALLIYLDPFRAAETTDSGTAILLTAVVYAIGWAIVPVVAIFLTRLLGLTPGYVPLVVAYNWTSVPQIVLQAMVALISELGLLPQGLAGILLFAAVVYILVYEWFVVRTALETTTATAIGIVILFEVLGIALNLTAFSYF
jgi:hypothetical protein